MRCLFDTVELFLKLLYVTLFMIIDFLFLVFRVVKLIISYDLFLLTSYINFQNQYFVICCLI